MNKLNVLTTTTLTALLLSVSAIADDGSSNQGPSEIPNCEPTDNMDLSKADSAAKETMEKCKAVHVSDATNAETEVVPPIGTSPSNSRRKIGHDAPMVPSAPPHERANHRKVYEVPDCENMSNMYHTNTDQFDPIIQEMMKNCTDVDVDEKAGDDDQSNGD